MFEDVIGSKMACEWKEEGYAEPTPGPGPGCYGPEECSTLRFSPVQNLIEALGTDPGYYKSWRDNISMAFQDEYCELPCEEGYHPLNVDQLKAIADRAANSFLRMLTGRSTSLEITRHARRLAKDKSHIPGDLTEQVSVPLPSLFLEDFILRDAKDKSRIPGDLTEPVRAGGTSGFSGLGTLTRTPCSGPYK